MPVDYVSVFCSCHVSLSSDCYGREVEGFLVHGLEVHGNHSDMLVDVAVVTIDVDDGLASGTVPVGWIPHVSFLRNVTVELVV